MINLTEIQEKCLLAIGYGIPKKSLVINWNGRKREIDNGLRMALKALSHKGLIYDGYGRINLLEKGEKIREIFDFVLRPTPLGISIIEELKAEVEFEFDDTEGKLMD